MNSRTLSFRPTVMVLSFLAVAGVLAAGHATTTSTSAEVVAGQFRDDVCIGRNNTQRIDEQGRVWEWRQKQGPVQPGKCAEWEWVRVR